MNRRRIVLRVVLTLLSVAAVSFIFYNSLQSADDSTVRSTGLREWINRLLQSLGLRWQMSEHFVRKAAHFVEFFILGALLSATVYAYVPRRRMMLCLALPLGAAVAVCDELIQSGSAGRSSQWSDVLLDSAAVLTAVLIAMGIVFLKNRRKRTEKGRVQNE